MTPIFCYGSLNLTKMLGVKTEAEVMESLRPYLYHKDGGDIYLNVTVKEKKEVTQYGQTHTLVASRKGVQGSVNLCDFYEYIRPGNQPQQPAPQPQQPQQPQQQGDYNGVDF